MCSEKLKAKQQTAVEAVEARVARHPQVLAGAAQRRQAAGATGARASTCRARVKEGLTWATEKARPMRDGPFESAIIVFEKRAFGSALI
jgi:hypothetical protein